VVVLLGVLEEAPMSVLVPGVAVVLPAVPEALMSVLVPGVVVLGVVPAPMEVPLPVLGIVLGVVVLEVLLLVLLVSLGEVVVDGMVVELLELVESVGAASSFLPQALRDRAAIRARAAHCAIGDLIIRELLEGWFEWLERRDSVPAACGSL
jgi:hypothetical protein